MKPNYKALAEEYRQKWSAAEERINTLMFAHLKLRESIAEKEREIEKLKLKYSDALNSLVELQEAIIMKEEGK